MLGQSPAKLANLQHSGDLILSLRNPNYTLHLLFTVPLCYYLIKKLELGLMAVSDLLKFGHAQISVPKIGILMSKRVCNNP